MKNILLSLIFISFFGCSIDENYGVEKTVFQKIPGEESGIRFKNEIKENVATAENIFDYDYFYNGAGVGVADLNNDGLSEVLFTGNQAPNRLYLNKGDLEFEDITESSLININKKWSNGVTFADVNNDGWLDIYISQGGPNPATKRKNLLFINQKDLTFIERAVDYGLADMSISTQSAFFDFDKDGDLDCIVMNENPLFGLDPFRFNDALENNEKLLHTSSSHLYRNDGGTFVDITEQAGLLKPSFGLGLVVSDINDDNWLDVYIANDYYLPDVIYLNQGNGSFEEQVKVLTKQVSFAGMGADIADINNDNYKDIFVLDMATSDHYQSKTLMASMNTKRFNMLTNELGYQDQYMFNTFQLNNGNNTFKNIAQLTGLAKTNWSWSVLMADFNNDENKDIYITNGYRRYATNQDTRTAISIAQQVFNIKVPLDVKKRIYYNMPEEKVANMIYENKGRLSFTDKSKDWGIDDLSYSNGAAYADLDNDGDLELLVNNIDEEAFLYKNLSVENKSGNYLNVKTNGKLSESFPTITLIYEGGRQVIENKRVRGYRSAVDNMVHFGLGKVRVVDTVRVEWPSGKSEEKHGIKANRVITFDEESSVEISRQKKNLVTPFEQVNATDIGLSFKHQENEYDDFEKEILLPYKQSTLGPHMSQADVNGDGNQDLYIGGAAGQSGELYLGNGVGYKLAPNKAFGVDASSEDMESVFFDLDGDGDLELYVVSGGNEFPSNAKQYRDRLYINDGSGLFSKASSPTLNGFAYSGKSVGTIDFDNDDDLDLIIGNRIAPQQYPTAAPSTILENDQGELKDVTDHVLPDLKAFGIINTIITTDFDNDGWEDLLVAGEWSSIGLFRNVGGTFQNVSSKSNLNSQLGWWYSAQETDINNDGLPDFVMGNVGLNSKYKTSVDKPLKVFAADFDDNNTFDLVLSTKYEGDYVPFRGRECSTDQMPFISEKYTTYDSFARASVIDIFGDGLDDSYQKEVNTFESILLINKGDHIFERVVLPVEAQLFPILDIATHDVNGDGFEDLLLVGSIYNTEAETPRMDAGSGLVLISDQKGGYLTDPRNNRIFYLEGNSKSIEVLQKENGKTHAIVGLNNDGLSVFEIK